MTRRGILQSHSYRAQSNDYVDQSSSTRLSARREPGRGKGSHTRERERQDRRYAAGPRSRRAGSGEKPTGQNCSDAKTEQGDHRMQRREQVSIPHCEGQENNVSRHIRGKNLAESQVANCVHRSGGKRQADQEGVSGALRAGIRGRRI